MKLIAPVREQLAQRVRCPRMVNREYEVPAAAQARSNRGAISARAARRYQRSSAGPRASPAGTSSASPRRTTRERPGESVSRASVRPRYGTVSPRAGQPQGLPAEAAAPGLRRQPDRELSPSVIPVDLVHPELPATGVGAWLEAAQRRAGARGARGRLALGLAAELSAAGRTVLAGEQVEPRVILIGDQDLWDVALEVVAQDDAAVGQGVGEMRERAHVGRSP